MFRVVVSVFFCCLYFISLTPAISAMSEAQKMKIHEHFEAMSVECIKDHPIAADDIAELRAKRIPNGENAACFIACVMKKSGVMDDKGMLLKENILDMARKVFEDEEEIKNIENYLHSCAHVNTASVSDGDKGCERAKMAHSCMLENAAQFGFEV